jgi:hypothetical protein
MRLKGVQGLMVGLSGEGGRLVRQCLIGVVFSVMRWVLVTSDGETLVEVVESGDALVDVVGVIAYIVQGRQCPVLSLLQPTHKPILLSPNQYPPTIIYQLSIYLHLNHEQLSGSPTSREETPVLRPIH